MHLLAFSSGTQFSLEGASSGIVKPRPRVTDCCEVGDLTGDLERGRASSAAVARAERPPGAVVMRVRDGEEVVYRQTDCNEKTEKWMRKMTRIGKRRANFLQQKINRIVPEMPCLAN